MGEIVRLKDFKKLNVRMFSVYYDYGEYHNPTDLLADFISGLGSDPHGNCSPNKHSGNYDVYLSELDNRGKDIFVNFLYDGSCFVITDKHPRGQEISDLFIKHLKEKKVPWELRRKGTLLDRSFDFEDYKRG